MRSARTASAVILESGIVNRGDILPGIADKHCDSMASHMVALKQNDRISSAAGDMREITQRLASSIDAVTRRVHG